MLGCLLQHSRRAQTVMWDGKQRAHEHWKDLRTRLALRMPVSLSDRWAAVLTKIPRREEGESFVDSLKRLAPERLWAAKTGEGESAGEGTGSAITGFFKKRHQASVAELRAEVRSLSEEVGRLREEMRELRGGGTAAAAGLS